jgi:hypothetical protein
MDLGAGRLVGLHELVDQLEDLLNKILIAQRYLLPTIMIMRLP